MKKIVIMTGVHGNELSWIIAVKRIIDHWIIPISWSVVFVFANLLAIEKKLRYVDQNMNRLFWLFWQNGYEYLRVKEIIPYLDDADILLDIHNTIDCSAKPFLICEHPEYYDMFHCDYVLTWLDTLHPWGSDSYMNSKGKIWICLECWSIIDDIEITSQYAYEAIMNFLVWNWIIQWEKITYNSKKIVIYCDNIYMSQYGDFILNRLFHEFEIVKKWQLIGFDWWNQVFASDTGYLVFARNVSWKWEECFVFWK